jgi:hypothetical protein
MGDQAGDGSTTARVGTEDLAQEDPQRDQRGKDPVPPNHLNRRQRTRDYCLGEDVGERQIAVLKELTAEKSNLLLKPTLFAIRHPRGLLLGDGYVLTYHFTGRGLSAYVVTSQGLVANYVPFVSSTEVCWPHARGPNPKDAERARKAWAQGEAGH